MLSLIFRIYVCAWTAHEQSKCVHCILPSLGSALIISVQDTLFLQSVHANYVIELKNIKHVTFIYIKQMDVINLQC